MARNSRSYAHLVTGWEKTATALAANAADLPHLEGRRTRLDALLEQISSLSAQQSVLTASKQDVSKRLQAALQEASSLADFLRTGVREHYGTRSEKLVEFGLQPFRGRTRAARPVEKPTPQPTSPTPPTEPND
jgi:ABC-type transporter Mla subunit MlaD